MTNDEQIAQLKECTILCEKIGKRIEKYENISNVNPNKESLFEEITGLKEMLKRCVGNLC